MSQPGSRIRGRELGLMIALGVGGLAASAITALAMAAKEKYDSHARGEDHDSLVEAVDEKAMAREEEKHHAYHLVMNTSRNVLDALLGTAQQTYAYYTQTMAERRRERAISVPADDGLRDMDMSDDTILVWGTVADIQKSYQRQAKSYDKINTVTGSYRLPIDLSYVCTYYLTLPEACRISRVCHGWQQWINIITQDRVFLIHCGRRGFDAEGGRFRGRAWQILSNSDLLIQQMRYKDTRARQQGEIRTFYQRLLSEAPTPETVTYADTISKDIDRTGIHLTAFKTHQEALDTLSRVLNAYAVHDNEVGYCQGLNFIAAFLLTQMSEEDAYWTFYTWMHDERFNMRRFYLPNLAGLQLHKYQFQRLFEWFLPELFQHFESQNIYADVFTEWFMTSFTFRAFPRVTVHRIWDLMLAEGPKTLHRVSLAILSLAQHALMELEFEDVIQYLKNLPDEGILSPDILIPKSFEFTIPDSLLVRLTASHAKEVVAQAQLLASQPPKRHKSPAPTQVSQKQ